MVTTGTTESTGRTGQLLAEDDDSNGNRNSRLEANAVADEIYVEVGAYNDQGTGQYELIVGLGNAGTTPVTPPTGGTVTPPTAGDFNIELRFDDSVPVNVRQAMREAAARWEQIIVGDLPDVIARDGGRIDDIRIDVSAPAAPPSNPNTLAAAGINEFRQNGMPAAGQVVVYQQALNHPLLVSVLQHEIGHVLGFGQSMYDRGLAVYQNGRPYFIGQNAVAAYNATHNTRANGIPLEDGGGTGSRGVHWDEETFPFELMSTRVGARDGGTQLSPITLGLLMDLGYQINRTTGTNYSSVVADDNGSTFTTLSNNQQIDEVFGSLDWGLV